ncbi:MAG: hypothetical protein E6G44_09605 [Actinobacteria bacterium]|nr:MAG: hypothetical protein E6G44_09605 [Actinomycetota bacterium]
MGIDKLLSFLKLLGAHTLTYDLRVDRPEAVLVMVYVPGHRYEVEFFGDGHVEVERFTSPGDIKGEEALEEILSFGEPST